MNAGASRSSHCELSSMISLIGGPSHLRSTNSSEPRNHNSEFHSAPSEPLHGARFWMMYSAAVFAGASVQALTHSVDNL